MTTRRFFLSGLATLAVTATGIAKAIPLETVKPTKSGAEWIICNGQSISRKSYPKLLATIGTLYGAADVDRFNVPDMRAGYSVSKNIGVVYAILAKGGYPLMPVGTVMPFMVQS